jgi:hypothetical protein
MPLRNLMKGSGRGHSSKVAKVNDRPAAGSFSALEQKFFEGAPPEIAVAPPPPPSFDDLDAGLPERRRVRRTAPRAVAAAPEREGRARAWLLRARAAIGSAIATGLARLRPAAARAWSWGMATARDGWGRLLVAARRTLESARPALSSAFSRFLDGLPGDRPDGRTVLATLAAVVVMCGLSATVLGSRGSAWRAPAPAADVGTATATR